MSAQSAYRELKMGRPSDFTEEIAAHICAEIGSGAKLSEICAADDMPGTRTVYGWLAKFPAFSHQYARAMEERTNAMAEEILAIADDSTGDGDGKGALSYENVQRSRLRVDARKWLMSKMNAKKYGDKLDHAVTGNMTVNVMTGVPRAGDDPDS